MENTSHRRDFSASRAIYQRLLLAYPRGHRLEYGAAMAQLFRDQCREAWNESRNWGLLKLWLRVLPDLVSTSILERLAALNERKSMTDKLANLFGFRIAPAFVFLKMFAVVFLLVFAISVIITFLLPESYASTARIRVQSDTPAINGHPSSYDPYFIQTTFEILQSSNVLGPVVEKLNLSERWGKAYNAGEMLKTAQTLDLLKARLDLKPVRNTQLINITVYSEDRNEAAQIANAVAQSYRDYRINQLKQLSLNGIKILEDEYQQEEAQIRQLQPELETLRQQHKIRFDASGPQSPEEQPYWDKKRNLEQMIGFHKLLAAKIEATRLELMIPKTSVAELISRAEPGNVPVKPNKPLNIALGAIAGIFLASVAGALAALIAFLLGKRMRKDPAPSAA